MLCSKQVSVCIKNTAFREDGGTGWVCPNILYINLLVGWWTFDLAYPEILVRLKFGQK